MQLRNADLTTKSETSGDRCKIHKYAGRIHLDYHGENAKGIFKDVAARLPQKYSKGRFLFINIWRNIADEPVWDHNIGTIIHLIRGSISVFSGNLEHLTRLLKTNGHSCESTLATGDPEI